MSRTKALSDALIEMIKARCPNAYYEEGVQVGMEKKKYPFVTLELEDVGYTDGSTKYVLELNVIDYGKIKSIAEQLADKIQDDLDHITYIDENIQFRSYKDGRKTIKEDDKQVIRKRLMFEIIMYDLKGEE
jgi:hypothetical protein